jgi:hypothetical protein
MHYRNGTEAKNGDKVIQLDFEGNITAFGVLHSAVAGNDYCNGQIATIQHPNITACIVDCLPIDEIKKMLAERNLDKRPSGK